MQRAGHRSLAHAVAGLMIFLQLVAIVGSAGAASHREAPLIALDPAADITDVYFFRSWTDPSKVVLVMNVIPGQEPSSGPNYFNFDDQVRYAFHLDTNAQRDGGERRLRDPLQDADPGDGEGAAAPGRVRGRCRPSRPCRVPTRPASASARPTPSPRSRTAAGASSAHRRWSRCPRTSAR